MSAKKNEKNVYPAEVYGTLSRTPDRDAFQKARTAVLSESVSWGGIGALSEKALHKILKLYVEPDTSYHEVEYNGSVADIKNERCIFEIQTRSYEKLLPKLKKLLLTDRVEVICPLATEKVIRWIDKESGEISSPNKSPKKENIYDAFKMLFGIREVIRHENLSVRVIYLKVEDFRNLNGYGKERKHYSTRIERIPTDIISEITLIGTDDYAALLPTELGEEFTAKEFSRAVRRTSRYSFYILKLLVSVGAIYEAGKRAKAVIYKKNTNQS